MQNQNFIVVILCPPMIYGKGSKEKYQKLINIADKVKIFPSLDNEPRCCL